MQSNPPGSQNYFQLARVLTALGQTDEAIQSLERALEAREFPLVFMAGDLLLAPLRSDPRFQNVVQAVGISTVSR